MIFWIIFILFLVIIGVALFKRETVKNEDDSLMDHEILEKFRAQQQLINEAKKEIKRFEREKAKQERAEREKAKKERAKQEKVEQERAERERARRILEGSPIYITHNKSLIDLAVFFSLVRINATLNNHFSSERNTRSDSYEVRMRTTYLIVIFVSCLHTLSSFQDLIRIESLKDGLSIKSKNLYRSISSYMPYESTSTKELLEILNSSSTPELSDYFKDDDLLLHSILYYRVCGIFSEILGSKASLSSTIWDKSIKDIEYICKKLNDVIISLFEDSHIKDLLKKIDFDRKTISEIIEYFSGYTGTCIELTSFIHRIEIKETNEIDDLNFKDLKNLMDGFDDGYFDKE